MNHLPSSTKFNLTVPLNSFVSGGIQLGYDEAAQFLREIAIDANELQNPAALIEKRAQKNARKPR